MLDRCSSPTATSRGDATLLQVDERPVHAGRVLGRRIPFRPLDDPRSVQAEHPGRPAADLHRRPGRASSRLGHFGGFRILPPFWTIEWARFFEVEGAGKEDLQPSRLIDTKLADVLTALPPEIGGRPALADRAEPHSRRPPAAAVGPGRGPAHGRGGPLTDADLGLPGGGPAPLWYYILKEASVQAGGSTSAKVGGRIVAEVFLGLMEKDPSSYLRNEPTLEAVPALSGRRYFTVADLITFTGHGLGRTALPDPPSEPPAG